jgi:hypothetical protein
VFSLQFYNVSGFSGVQTEKMIKMKNLNDSLSN